MLNVVRVVFLGGGVGVAVSVRVAVSVVLVVLESVCVCRLEQLVGLRSLSGGLIAVMRRI